MKNAMPSIAEDSIDRTKDKLADLNREQMMEGKNRFGEYLRPTYFEDPFFKSYQAAKNYADWKDRITPSSLRPYGVPNLFIIGVFHGSLSPVVSGGKIIFTSDFYAEGEIKDKYNGLYGLNNEKKAIYINESLRPAFNGLVRAKLR